MLRSTGISRGWAGWIKDDANIVHTEVKKIWADFDGLKLEMKQLRNIRDFGV